MFNKIDKLLSLPFELLNLGPLNHIIFIPGTWFGLISTISILNVLLIWTVINPTPKSLIILCIHFIIHLILTFKSNWFKILKSKFLVVFLQIYSYGIVCYTKNNKIEKYIWFYNFSILIGLFFLFHLKSLFKRERPIIYLDKKYNIDDYFPIYYINTYVKMIRDDLIDSSCPSGDVLCAMVINMILIKATNYQQPLYYMISLGNHNKLNLVL